MCFLTTENLSPLVMNNFFAYLCIANSSNLIYKLLEGLYNTRSIISALSYIDINELN